VELGLDLQMMMQQIISFLIKISRDELSGSGMNYNND